MCRPPETWVAKRHSNNGWLERSTTVHTTPRLSYVLAAIDLHEIKRSDRIVVDGRDTPLQLGVSDSPRATERLRQLSSDGSTARMLGDLTCVAHRVMRHMLSRWRHPHACSRVRELWTNPRQLHPWLLRRSPRITHRTFAPHKVTNRFDAAQHRFRVHGGG